MLDRTFRNTSSTLIEIDTALEATRLTALLTDNDIAARSYGLFRIIMKDLVSPSPRYSEKKWEASRLALHGAYKPSQFLPRVEDPQDILAFLSHHFELVENGEDHAEPIQSALRALAYAPSPKTIEALKQFDPTKPSFVCGIGFAFQDTRSRELRKAALFFLPLIADKLFYSPRPTVSDDGMKKLCVGWASTVDEVWDTDAVREPTLAVFLNMINCPHWRPHVVPEKWELLAHFDSVPDDSQPLARCLRNPGLVDAITTVGNPDAIVLWSKILLLKYSQLDPKVQERLQASVRGPQRTNADNYLSTIQSELDKAVKELLEYGTWTTTPGAVALKKNIDSHRAAIDFLKSTKRGYH